MLLFCDCAAGTFILLSGLLTDIRCKAVVELGIVSARANASCGIAAATTISGRVMYGGCAGAVMALPSARRRGETACAEGI